jgi:uncharacterized membrane-anchored protein
MRSLPKLNSKYWVALVAASIFGTNTGDFLAANLHFGNSAGLPYLLAVLGAIFLVEKISPWANAVFFWLAIIVIRTGATNVADITHEYGAYGLLFVPPILAMFVFAVRYYKSRAKATMSEDSVPRVDVVYWVCMALAGIVGTLLGDYSSGALAFGWYGASNLLGLQTGEFSFDWFWIGHIFATLIYGAIIVKMLRRFKLVELAQPYKYWTMIALIRTAGTVAGDYIAKTHLQLYGSTILTGLCFAALIAVFYVFDKDNQSTTIDIHQPA